MPSNKTNSAANPGRVCITLSFRLGVLLTLAMVATLMLVMTDITPAGAQSTATVRVSNMDQPIAGAENLYFGQMRAQAFCTSNVPVTLDKVRMYTRSFHKRPNSPGYAGTLAPSVAIRSDVSRRPGPVLHTLTNPSSIDETFDTAEDFTSSGYELAANTTYWLTVYRPDNTGHIQFANTLSTAEDSDTESGWSLGDSILAEYGMSYDAPWETPDEPYVISMAIYATGGAPTMSSPVFSNGVCGQKESYEFSMRENSAASTVVGAATAREPDGDSLTYSVGGTDAAKFNRVFALDASTGEITVKPGATVDYESKSSYSLTFSVTDGEDASGSPESEPTTDDTAQVSIRVTNIDEPGSVSLSTTDPRVGRSVRASISDPDGWPKPFRIEWARAFRATTAFIPFLPISVSDMTPESYTPTEEDKYQFLRVTIFYFDNECRRVYVNNNDCRRTAEGTFAKAVADEDGLIVQLQTVNTPATGEMLLWNGDRPVVTRQLIAQEWDIRDADGMIGARLRYQFVTVDPKTGVETKVYTNNSCRCNPLNTYTLRNSARGKAVMVRVHFEDDRGHTEVVASRLTTLVPVVGNSSANGGVDVRGTARVGGTLSVYTGRITDPDGMEDSEFTYQWLRSEGTYNTSIEGATGSTYVPVAADEGTSIKVRVGFTDDAGYYESFTSGGTAPVAAAPVSLFTASTHDTPESHDGSAAFTFELRFSEAPADGVTDSTLEDHALAVIGGTVTDVSQLETGKNLRWEITVQPSGNEEVIVTLPPTIDRAAQGAICTGDGRMLSVALAILVPGPQNAPTITGTARVGETLTASATGIADTDGLTNVTFTYQWLADDTDITDATGATYTPAAADAGKAIKVRVSFTDDAGNAETLTSGASAAVTAANNPATGAPTISGTARVGETLTASATGIADSDGLTNATFTYQWIKLDSNLNDSDISGATSSTYTLVAGDADTGIKVRVSFTDDRGNTESLTTESALIVTAANSPATGAPTISGTAQVGETLTASTSGISDSDGLTSATFTYQWLADDAAISGATGSTYTLVAADSGKAIKVQVSFTDDRGNTESLTSVVTAAVTAVNSPATGAPTISGTAQAGETLTASTTGIADTDGLTNATFTYQWLADDTDITDATDATYTPAAADAGKAIKVQVSFTDDAGNAESLTSAATTAAALPPLTASAHDVPASHDGSAAFTFELHFSETPNDGFSYKTLRDHAFTATGGEVVKARRLEPGKNVRWEITVQPSGNAGVTVALPATTDCSSQGAICTGDGRKLSSALEVTVPGPEASSQRPQQQNSAATGAPAITGTARMGETLTANTTGIADSDGLTRATFAYQWLADDADITDATGSTYTPAAIDAGKAIMVEVSFTDDAGNAETLTSAATAAVTLPPLTASAHGVPASHDGSAAFTFELRFSEEMPLSYKTLRDHAFTATGGEVVKARRLEAGKNVRWEITVRPDGDGTVTIVLPVTEDCASSHAICTGDGRPLSNRLELTVAGPDG